MDRQWWQSLYGLPPLIWIILIGSFFGRGTYFMVWPFLAILLHEKFSLGPAYIGLILSVSAMAATLLGFYMGTLSDRYGRRTILILGTLINTCAFALLAVAESLSAFVVSITLCSIGRAIWEPPASALFGDLIKQKQVRELALQFRYFLINVGAALGPVVGVWVGISAQQSTFGLTALSYLFLCLGFVWAFRYTTSGVAARLKRHPPTSFRATLTVLRRDKAFLIVVFANILTLFIYAHMDSSLVQYLTQSSAPDLIQLISSMILVNASTIILLQFPLLKLMRALSINRRIVMGIFVLAAGQVWFAINPVHWFYGWLGATFVVSVAETILFPTMSIQVDRMAPDHLRGSYFGATSFYTLGWSSAPLVGGFVIEKWSGSSLYWGTFLLCGLVLFLYFRSGRITDTSPASDPSPVSTERSAAL
ncbi:MDR family MFS transporter [Microbulbifer harenosus]|uniref:MFS transporter n=1 Tax=Microbulbifer harenosus TaxID=2576840 RepID=A0ABY2ULM1_9GAMM|nr:MULTISPECIES: MFS transporter [Microbulbifer]QIL89564.1 MFS transporter [Microbulbifer sp. SH-1]TLM78417.1 MFS transporter [Microbulbifer harenosus]